MTAQESLRSADSCRLRARVPQSGWPTPGRALFAVRLAPAIVRRLDGADWLGSRMLDAS
ncbi:hypothetical protein [Streptomyces sp. NPDC056255]|uniref:hypothetical protein n=1 Tax=Streptomyces sp. NPDC056255 TaxID=3345764 RepID=UPI0035D73227